MKLAIQALILLTLAIWLPGMARAQETRTLEVRVVSADANGVVHLDRGMEHGLVVGDLVSFHLAPDKTHEGTLIMVEASTAIVQLHYTDIDLAAGTTGEISIPKERPRPPVPPAPVLEKPEAPPVEKVAPVEPLRGSAPEQPAKQPVKRAPAPALPAPASDEQVSLRVSSSGPGASVEVDRGSSDGLEIGDVVTFSPREGGSLRGSVVRVEERTAVVEMRDPSRLPATGTRGEVTIPGSRLAGSEDPLQPEGVPEVEQPGPEQEGDAEHPPWQNGDESYSSGMPLLAEVRAVRPEDRDARLTGRVYLIADYIYADTDDDTRSDAFLRGGTDLLLENPFGIGGGLSFDGEYNYKRTDVPDQDDEDETELRVDRLSYNLGGTRYSSRRMEIGRFLQYGMPEFGLLDGFEYGRRKDNGQRYGASIGLMPEPDPDLESGNDFQVSGWYRWVSDATEEMSASGGYQKTWHNGNADRDLFVGKFTYLPPEGWNFLSTAWIDFYTSGDDAKGSGLGLTQAYARTGHRWASGDGVNVTYSHISFPEIDRNEFLPVTEDQLEDDHSDRVGLDGWTWLSRETRFSGDAGVWVDEDESGGDLEFGLEMDELFQHRSKTGLFLFGTAGEFSNVLGTRLSYGRFTEDGRWDVSYEYANHDQEGFDEDNDDVFQHWLRANRDFFTASGWDLSVTANARYWDFDSSWSWSLGVFAQRSF